MTTKLGEALNDIVGPILMGVIFFAVFTPAALIMRVVGRENAEAR